MSDLNIFKQPKAFYLIFSIEFWERFGFYGMQAILTVYLVKILGMNESASFVLFGAFSALIYGFVAAGVWFGAGHGCPVGAAADDGVRNGHVVPDLGNCGSSRGLGRQFHGSSGRYHQRSGVPGYLRRCVW